MPLSPPLHTHKCHHPYTWSSDPLLKKPSRMYPTDTRSSPAPLHGFGPSAIVHYLFASLFPFSDTQLLKGRDSSYSTLIPKVWLGAQQQHKPRNQEEKREENLPAVGNLSPRLQPASVAAHKHQAQQLSPALKALGRGPWATHPSTS